MAGFAALGDQFGSPTSTGYGFRTTDGGRSWQPQLISSELLSIADAGQTAFGVGRSGSFYATGNGGVLGAPTTLTIQKQSGKTSQAAQKKPGKGKPVKVSGTLTPAEGGEQVVVSIRQGTNWSSQVATVASNGSFGATFSAKGQVSIVAQWQGDDDRAGDGTEPLKVKVKKKKSKKK